MRSKKGFSLVEIMIAVALLGGLALALMKFSSMQAKQSKRSEQMLDGFQVFSTIGASLLNAQACKLTLQGTTINAASVNLATAAIKNSSDQSLVALASRVGAVRIDGLKILAPAGGVPANTVGVVELEVEVTRIGSGGVDEQKVTKKFPLNVSVDGAQQVTGCYSSLDNAIESSRQLACEDLGGVYNSSATPVCQLGNLSILGSFTTPSSINAGSATISGAVQASSFQYTSDRRWKKNISEIDSTLESILKLRPIHFFWKNSHTFENKQDVGFIAQEVEKEFPGVVFNQEDHKTVDYIRLTPYLVKAIQEQQKEIDQLKLELKRFQENK